MGLWWSLSTFNFVLPLQTHLPGYVTDFDKLKVIRCRFIYTVVFWQCVMRSAGACRCFRPRALTWLPACLSTMPLLWMLGEKVLEQRERYGKSYTIERWSCDHLLVLLRSVMAFFGLLDFFLLLQIEMLADSTGQLTKVSKPLSTLCMHWFCTVLLFWFYIHTLQLALTISTIVRSRWVDQWKNVDNLAV